MTARASAPRRHADAIQASADRLPDQPKASLRRRMSWRVLLPLGLTWLLGNSIALTVAWVYVGRAYDRSLLDDAQAIAANVVARDEGLVLTLSSREITALLYDQTDQAVFAVRTPDGRLLAGHPELRATSPETVGPRRSTPAASAASNGTSSAKVDDSPTTWAFVDGAYRGQPLRVVILQRHRPETFEVVLGLTTGSRAQLLQGLVLSSVAPQALLLLLLGWWLRFQIGRELEPLSALQRALERRDAADLTPVSVDASSRDVAQLTIAANALMVRIERAVWAQREFAGNVAHDLRTPMAGIRALAEFGLSHDEPEVWRTHLERIAQSEQRATRLIDQLLALALADEAQDSVRLVPVRVDEAARDVVLNHLPRADALGVDLGAVGLDTPVWAWASLALLEGVLSNLIDNALRYGRPIDGHAPQVTVEVARVGAELGISVSDNGPGLPPERRSHVLQRGAQGEDGRRRGEGSGLGLAIVSRYAALLNGRLGLDAADGGIGLRVTVWLQAADGEGEHPMPSAG